MASRNHRRRNRRTRHTTGRAGVALPVTPKSVSHARRRNTRKPLHAAALADAPAPAHHVARTASVTWPDTSPFAALLPSALLGLAAGLTTAALAGRLSTDPALPLAGSPAGVAGACLAMLAVGLRLPRRFALLLADVHFPGRAAFHADTDHNGTNNHRDTPPLPWTVLGAAGMLAALGVLGTVAAVNPLIHAWQSVHAQFIWSDVPGRIVSIAFAALCAAPALIPLGAAISCAQRVIPRDSVPAGDGAAAVSIGAATGALVGLWADSAHWQVAAVLAGGSLPPLFVTAQAGWLATGRPGPTCPRVRETVADSRDPWSLAIIAVTALAGFSVAAIGRCVPHLLTDSDRWHPAIGLGAVALGMAAGTRRPLRGSMSPGAWGTLAAFTGSGTALAAVLDTWGRPSLATWVTVIAGHAMLGLVVHGGFTLHTTFSRKGAVGTMRLLSGLLVSAAAALWLIPERVLEAHAPLILAGLGLMLFAAGGTLRIHDPHPSRSGRRAQLAGIFGALAALMLATLFRR